MSELVRVMGSEDTFEMPASWRRVARRRRGGTLRTPATADDGAPDKVAGWAKQGEALTVQSMNDPDSDRRLAEELRAHLAGQPAPRGAALHARLIEAAVGGGRTRMAGQAAFADAWAAAHGLAFAAAAVTELADTYIQLWRPNGGMRPDEWLLRSGPARNAPFWHWAWQPVADRMRDLLADASDADYQAGIEALAGRRRTRTQRVLASYLMPTETAWMDECCAEANFDDRAQTMLFCSVGSAEQLAALNTRTKFGFGQWKRGVMATLIEAVGVDEVVALIAESFDRADAQDRKVAAEVLSRLPTDEAFRLLIEHGDDMNVSPALLDATERYPMRALRLREE